MGLRVIVAQPHGFCAGVSRAIKIVKDTAQKYPGKTIYLLGEIVHNRHVVNDLKKNYRVKIVNSTNDLPKGSILIIRAHGAAPAVHRLKNLVIVDATCPLVKKVHDEVRRLKNKNIIYLVSSRDHDEAVGVLAEGSNITAYTLVEFNKIKADKNSVLITQTTLSVQETEEFIKKLKKKYPMLKVLPHICPATTDRQRAVKQLAEVCDLILIVGSHESSNSQRLYETAKSSGKPAYIVDHVGEIKRSWLKNCHTVGLSSGASTPEDILQSVYNYLTNLYASS